MSTSTTHDFTLANAWCEFWKHPSPWMIGAIFAVALGARMVLGDWQITDTLVPAVMVAAFPFFEWMVHVFIAHCRRRRIGGLIIDPLLARKHRAHHADPRIAALIFIPWQVLPWVLGGAVVIALLAFPRLGLGLSYLALIMAVGLGYEWIHHLIHTGCKPKTPACRAIWRNHRLHHFKNEHYWFTISTSGTADRVMRNQPDPANVPTSPTAKNLHASLEAPQNVQRHEGLRQKRGERCRNRPRQRGHRNHPHRFAFRVPAALRTGSGALLSADQDDRILCYVQASAAVAPWVPEEEECHTC